MQATLLQSFCHYSRQNMIPCPYIVGIKKCYGQVNGYHFWELFLEESNITENCDSLKSIV